ncbi:MAG: PilT/PilU family type 4a pilus ATPase [Candidatus Magasanikbacteria bacterium]
MKPIKSYFELALKSGASDLHLVGGEKPVLRIEGNLKNIEEEIIPTEEIEKAVLTLLDNDKKKNFEDNMDLDFGFELNETRFRINLHRQNGTVGLAARVIPKEIPTPKDLRFEKQLLEATNLMDGLVLIVGPTGHGKSTTLASMINEINKNRKSHIITIEDPIEFIFADDKSLIEQREVGTDTNSFASALKHVLRQDPNVILVGEMRDLETISIALTAAETGHLVLSTLHAGSAAEAIERIIDVFDGPQQKQVMIQLASVLRVIVTQQLLPTIEGGRVAAREILVNNSAVSNMIKESNIAQIYSAIQTGAKNGMQSMENALKDLVEDGIVSEEVAEKRMLKHKQI